MSCSSSFILSLFALSLVFSSSLASAIDKVKCYRKSGGGESMEVTCDGQTKCMAVIGKSSGYDNINYGCPGKASSKPCPEKDGDCTPYEDSTLASKGKTCCCSGDLCNKVGRWDEPTTGGGASGSAHGTHVSAHLLFSIVVFFT